MVKGRGGIGQWETRERAIKERKKSKIREKSREKRQNKGKFKRKMRKIRGKSREKRIYLTSLAFTTYLHFKGFSKMVSLVFIRFLRREKVGRGGQHMDMGGKCIS